MPNWEALATNSDGAYEAHDFERCAYRLMSEQTIYAADRGNARDYEVVCRHIGAFRDAFNPFGVVVMHNPHHGYLTIIPRHQLGPRMKLDEARLALVLRRIYDDRMNAADIIAGEAIVTMDELGVIYPELLGKMLPDRSELRNIVKSLKRSGIAREIEASDDQPFQVAVRPAIVELLGRNALEMLAAHAPASNGADTPVEDVADSDKAQEGTNA